MTTRRTSGTRVVGVAVAALTALGVCFVYLFRDATGRDVDDSGIAPASADEALATATRLEMPAGEPEAHPPRAERTEAAPSSATSPHHPLILSIEKRFPFNNKRFSELPLDQLSLSELQEIATQISVYQGLEQSTFFETTNPDSLEVVSQEEYDARQMWLFLDLLLLPIKEEGGFSGKYAVLDEQSCPSIFGLREMHRTLRRVNALARHEQERYTSFIEGVTAEHPHALMVENADRSVVYFYEPDGTICASLRVSSVGNF